MRFYVTIWILLAGIFADAQTLGGNSVFNFLKLPNSPQLTALGGINVSNLSNDVGLAFQNPSLLKSEMHSQTNIVFNDFYSGIKVLHLSLAYHQPGLQTNFAWGLHYFDYGEVTATDAAGNINGQIKPTDWVMNLSASRNYLQKWTYGATLKFISSNYGLYRSNGIAADVGVLYRDTAHLLSVSVVASNMGFQLKEYEGTEADDIPFDLRFGITKKLKDAPLSFSLTAHHLHRIDIFYNDTLFNNDNGTHAKNNRTFHKIFNHFVVSAQINPTEHLEFSLGYNHLRRQELNIANTTNGLNGFSMGIGVVLQKLQIRYARAYYQNNTAYHQFGLNLKLNEFFGLGKFGEKIGW